MLLPGSGGRNNSVATAKGFPCAFHQRGVTANYICTSGRERNPRSEYAQVIQYSFYHTNWLRKNELAAGIEKVRMRFSVYVGAPGQSDEQMEAQEMEPTASRPAIARGMNSDPRLGRGPT